MPQQPVLSNVARVLFADGSETFLEEQQAHRVAYALTTPAFSPIINHVHVQAVFDAKGEKLWWSRSYSPN